MPTAWAAARSGYRDNAEPTVPLTIDDVRRTTSQVARPIFFATLIIVSAYVPLFSFERAEAKLLGCLTQR